MKRARLGDDVQRIAAADPRLVLFPGHDLGGAPPDRPDVVLHHAEWFSVDAWPVSP